MARPLRADISLSALRHNYAEARRHAPRSRVFAVVKANAYGHGIERAVRALADADGFGTIELDGAVRVRQSGFTGTILLLEGFFEPGELDEIAGARIATAVQGEEQLRMLESGRLRAPVDCFLKINTGMNRLGFPPGETRAALERLKASGAAKSITLMTHFATADGPEGVGEAMRRFDEATRGMSLPRTLANSAAIFAHAQTHGDIVRAGIALYGAAPFPQGRAADLGLRPAMTLRSKLIAIQSIGAGETVGYGATFRAPRDMRIGVVACGYADGYPRHAPSGTPIVVDGVITGTVGRSSMDMICVDLTPVPQARFGSPVVLWGDELPIDDVARSAGTVGYELMCALAPRVTVAEIE